MSKLKTNLTLLVASIETASSACWNSMRSFHLYCFDDVKKVTLHIKRSNFF